MTYLGYQVRNLKSCGNQVQNWLASHKEDGLKISYRTVVDFGWTESPIGDLSAIENADFDDFKCFEANESQCSFTTESHSYVIEVVDLPSDKWGNTATYENAPDCVWINYCDDSGNYPNLNIDETLLDGYDFADFVEWVESLGENDKIGKIEEEIVCNGTTNSYYYTTVKDQESLDILIQDYVRS